MATQSFLWTLSIGCFATSPLLRRMDLDRADVSRRRENVPAGYSFYIAAPLGIEGRDVRIICLSPAAFGDDNDESQTAFFSERVCRQVSLALDNILSYEQIAKAQSETRSGKMPIL